MVIAGPQYGFGTHLSFVEMGHFTIFIRSNYIYNSIYNFSLGSVKLAILAFYYRVFSTVIFRRVVVFFGAIICLWLFGISVSVGLLCVPIERFWNRTIPGKCMDLLSFSYFQNISNLVTDVIIFLLPVPLILRLQTSLQQKLALCGVFCIGVV